MHDRITVKYKNGETKQFTFDVSTYGGTGKRDKLFQKIMKDKKIDCYNFEVNIEQNNI